MGVCVSHILEKARLSWIISQMPELYMQIKLETNAG